MIHHKASRVQIDCLKQEFYLITDSFVYSSITDCLKQSAQYSHSKLHGGDIVNVIYFENKCALLLQSKKNKPLYVLSKHLRCVKPL